MMFAFIRFGQFIIFLSLIVSIQSTHSADFPTVQAGIYRGGTINTGNTPQPGDPFDGLYSMLVYPNSDKAIVLGWQRIAPGQVEAFFDDDVDILIDNSIGNNLSGSFTKNDLNGVIGDSINAWFVNDSFGLASSLAQGFFTTENGVGGTFTGARNTFAKNSVISKAGGYYVGSYIGSCDTGDVSGVMRSLATGSSPGNAIANTFFLRLPVLFVDDATGEEDVGDAQGLGVLQNGLVTISTEFGSVFNGSLNFATHVFSGSWAGADNCSGTWSMTRVIEENNPTHAAANLPISRSIQVGDAANVFVSLINTNSTVTALDCGLSLALPDPGVVLYQTTDPFTNLLTGTLNTPVDIPPGSSQSFLFSYTPTVEIAPIETNIIFNCLNTGIEFAFTAANTGAKLVTGVNTLFLTSEVSPVPDIIALTTEVNLQLTENISQVFAVSSVNVGNAGDEITITPEPTFNFSDLDLFICEIDSSAKCLSTPSQSITTTINPGDTPAFAVFVTANRAISPNALNRIIISFEDENGILRGATSTAVSTL